MLHKKGRVKGCVCVNVCVWRGWLKKKNLILFLPKTDEAFMEMWKRLV